MAESQWGFPGWARDNNFSSSVTSILDREGFTSLEALLNCERHDLEALEIGRGHLVSLRTAVTKLQAEHGGGPLCEARERVSELVVKQATVHDRLSQNWQDQPQPSDNNTATSKGRETVINSSQRPKGHAVKEILLTDKTPTEDGFEDIQQRLLQIYRDQIHPLGEAYHFVDLNRDAISEGEMMAKPMILFLGPWSTGKSTMINYLLGTEHTTSRLHTGAQPTTTDFTVVTNGSCHRVVKGIQLVSDRSGHYSPLQKFGLNFLERFEGIEVPSELLERVTLVDTPGIIENKKQQERGYPFNEVCQWFIDRAQLIFLMFDPSKLDIGSELEILFKQLKGHEAKLRLILNKADTVSTQELMRVYGALFWSLAPLVNEVEPPRVFVGSLWSESYRPGTMYSLFEEEEISLLTDMDQAIRYQLENKIAATRRHAFLVRLHALSVVSYKEAFDKHNGWFVDKAKLWSDILMTPEEYNVHIQLLQNHDVSVHDLPTPEMYQHFFAMNNRDSFKKLSKHYSFRKGYDMDRLVQAITVDLPNLLHDLRSRRVPTEQATADQ